MKRILIGLSIALVLSSSAFAQESHWEYECQGKNAELYFTESNVFGKPVLEFKDDHADIRLVGDEITLIPQAIPSRDILGDRNIYPAPNGFHLSANLGTGGFYNGIKAFFPFQSEFNMTALLSYPLPEGAAPLSYYRVQFSCAGKQIDVCDNNFDCRWFEGSIRDNGN